MNARLETDLQKLERAIERLNTVMTWPPSHDGRIEAGIQCLEFVVELYWKLLKRMLHIKGITVFTPRDVFREAFAAGWLDDENIWIKMIKDRNMSSHTYNESLANEIHGRLSTYLPVALRTFAKLRDLSKDGFAE